MTNEEMYEQWRQHHDYMMKTFGAPQGFPPPPGYPPYPQAPYGGYAPAGAAPEAPQQSGLASLLPGKVSEQFLMGALIGAAGAYLLADEKTRAKIIKAGMGLYASVAGGMAEMKEQMADIKAEMEAAQDMAQDAVDDEGNA